MLTRRRARAVLVAALVEAALLSALSCDPGVAPAGLATRVGVHDLVADLALPAADRAALAGPRAARLGSVLSFGRDRGALHG